MTSKEKETGWFEPSGRQTKLKPLESSSPPNITMVSPYSPMNLCDEYVLDAQPQTHD